GEVTGFNHEAVFYDPEALVEPIRIVRNFKKVNELGAGTPYAYIECVQTLYPVNGVATPLAPGAVFEYEVPDMFGRPWARIWEKSNGQGMSRPDENEDILDSEYRRPPISEASLAWLLRAARIGARSSSRSVTPAAPHGSR